MRNLGIAAIFTCGAVAQAEPVTIAALGDSLTAGYGLEADDGLVPQLEAWLNDNGADVVLINAGVSGDTTAGGLSRVGWTLTPDVDGMIVTLGGNDFLRGIDPAVSRENLRGILQAAKNADVDVLLIGIEASNNYGPDYKAAFDSMYPDLAAEFGVQLVPRFFQGVLDAAGVQDNVRNYMQRDRIHPNPAGVKVIVETLGPEVLAFVTRVSAQ
ncbi:arylesterase [Octadecabacter sp. R77987]|uniref:arylesterase n=1 Tax=Octadecabacter sp. R77987 TaxID=3093874 RepID=UPI0036702935